jgi:cytochrome b6-f complex iron-sulfur subunit
MEQNKPSTAEILAKIRAQKGAGAAPASLPAAAPAESSPAAEVSASAAAPPPKTAVPAAKPGSTKDILAAIRAGGAAGAAKAGTPSATAPVSATAEAPAVKAPAPKPAAPSGPLPSVQEMLKAVREGKPVEEISAGAKAKAPVAVPPMPQRPIPPSKKAVAPPPARRSLSGIVTVAAISAACLFLGVVTGSAIWYGIGVLIWGVLMTPFAAAWTSLAAVTGISVLGTARFMFPNVLTEPPSKFKVGPASDYPLNTVSNKWKDQFGVWIVHSDQYEGKDLIYALTAVCTHLGCTPNWLEGEQKFKCPCHGSGFYITGVNFEGPAPRPLERAGIRIAEDGMLEVDKSMKFQEEMGQWADPNSFVQV